MQLKYRLFIPLMACTLVMGCSKQASTEAESSPQEVTPHAENRVILTEGQAIALGIQTAAITHRALKRSIHANGVLDVPPQNLVSIAAPFGGYLKSSSLLPGSKVSKGQLIAILEHPDFVTLQQEYLEHRSQAAFLEAEFQRQTLLASENVNARKSLEKARADHEAMKARLAGQRAKLEMLHINLQRLESGEIVKEAPLYSPITGYVTEMKTNIGAYLQPSEAVLKIADTGHLHAELTVYEQDLPYLGIGQKVLIQLGNESQSRTGTIHLLGRAVEGDHSVKVHVHFDEEAPTLVPGTYLQAEIEVEAQSVPCLPDPAWVHYQGRDYAFMVIDDQAHTYQMLEISPGMHENGYTELKEAEVTLLSKRYVVVGAYGLLSILKNIEED